MSRLKKTKKHHLFSHSFLALLSFRTMTNLLMITVALLLHSHVTWAASGWEEMGVTCEREVELTKVCTNLVKVHKCRGTCRSLSIILMASPWYRTKCECCKSTGFTDEFVQCPDGSSQKIRHVTGCACQLCEGA